MSLRSLLGVGAIAGVVAVFTAACSAAPADSNEGTGSSEALVVRCPLPAAPAGALPCPPEPLATTPLPPWCGPRCPIGDHFDPIKCACEPNACLPKLCIVGDHWDASQCACVPNCQPPQTWDAATSSCVPPICTPPLTLNPTTGTCTCSVKVPPPCRFGTVWNPATCTCGVCPLEASVICPVGAGVDSLGCPCRPGPIPVTP